MTIKRDGWFCQLLMLEYKDQTTVCAIFWRMVLCLAILAFMLFTIGVMGVCFYEMGLKIDLYIVGTVAAIVGLLFLIDWIINSGSTTLAVTKAYIKAKKEKYCPIVHIE